MYHKIYENKPHNNIAIGFYNLGLNYVDAEDKVNAREHIQKSVAMFTLLEGPDGAQTKKVEEALSKWNLI